MTNDIEVTIDGTPWHVGSEYSQYDAIHTVAGALLAGAECVQIRRENGTEMVEGPPEMTDEKRAAIPSHPKEEMGAPEYAIDEVRCVLCDEISDTLEDHERHMILAHAGSDDTDDGTDEGEDDSGETPAGDARGLDALLDIDGIGASKIEALREDGFETLHDIREASVADVAQEGSISTHYASRITNFAVDVLEGDSGGASDELAGEQDTEADTDGTDLENEEVELEGNGTGPDDIEPLDPADIETALAEFDVPHTVEVSDVVQAVDGNRQCFRVGRDLGIDRPTADVLVSSLGLKPALESDDGLTAKRLALANEGGEEA